MVVEHCNIDIIEELCRLLNSGSWNAMVPMLAKNSGAQVKIGGLVIEQKNTDRMKHALRLRTVDRIDFGRFTHRHVYFLRALVRRPEVTYQMLF
jgi:hypothetical protein